ncbi:MAG: HDOD domain-containing protein, partial [Candidatus Cloacimonetes bacterium]|nr:HDOD domain-containing protein [Candidatus Cloacimonadota bacterium]
HLREIIYDQDVINIVSRVKSIPVLPDVYLQIVNKLKDSSATLKEISQIIFKDIALTAKILQLVNSSFFGLYRKINDPVQAVSLLGIETIKSLVLSVKIFEKFSENSLNSELFTLITKHSMKVAEISKKIASANTKDIMVINDSFTAGILHDIGILVLSTEFPDFYKNNVSLDLTNFYSVELNHFKTTHGEIGGYLMALWGLSDPIVEAIALHHRPSESKESCFSPLTAIYIANMLVSNDNQWDESYLDRIGVTDRINDYRKLLGDDYS